MTAVKPSHREEEKTVWWPLPPSDNRGLLPVGCLGCTDDGLRVRAARPLDYTHPVKYALM